MNNKQSVGVWGYGIVGKSAVNYFLQQGYAVSVMDKRILSSDEHVYLQNNNIALYSETLSDDFFSSHDYIFSSPGILMTPAHEQYHTKWLNELTIFNDQFKKSVIAITGSVGKTSTTHMIASLLTLAHKKFVVGGNCVVGGNIGAPLLSLLRPSVAVDYGVVELSSFQLQHCHTCTPDIALWTNLYPNHLDHHASEEEYFLAKYNILKYQRNTQHAIIDLSLRKRLPALHTTQKRIYCTQEKPEDSTIADFCNNEFLYYLSDNIIVCYNRNMHRPVLSLDAALKSFSFLLNIIFVTALCELLGYNTKLIYQLPMITQLPPHRLQKICTVDTVDFYNDSKSTTVQTTLAAVRRLCHRPIHLFFGGLSKGVDRTPCVKELAPMVTHIYCFGKEADELYALCKKNSIPASSHPTLEHAVELCMRHIQKNDIVLLSPAGSSYDLYTNYEERGIHFMQLIKEYSILYDK